MKVYVFTAINFNYLVKQEVFLNEKKAKQAMIEEINEIRGNNSYCELIDEDIRDHKYYLEYDDEDGTMIIYNGWIKEYEMEEK